MRVRPVEYDYCCCTSSRAALLVVRTGTEVDAGTQLCKLSDLYAGHACSPLLVKGIKTALWHTRYFGVLVQVAYFLAVSSLKVISYNSSVVSCHRARYQSSMY